MHISSFDPCLTLLSLYPNFFLLLSPVTLDLHFWRTNAA